MRVLYAAFDRVPAPKGASRHIRAVLRGLVAAGHEVDLLAIGEAGSVEGARHLGFTPPRGNYLDQGLAFEAHVRQVLAGSRHDVWHARDIWAGFAMATAPKRPLLIAEINGLTSIELPYRYPRLHQATDTLAVIRRREDVFLAAADGLLTPSPVTAGHLAERGVPASRVRVVPNGADRPPHALPTPWPEILYVGTFSPWQGLETLIEALPLVPPPTRLRLVGPPGPGWAAELRRRAARLGVADRVILQPPVPAEDVWRLIAAATLCVAPLDASPRNLTQGCCPLKVLEAMAAARPVVASALPAVEALITHGETGWLVPPDDAPALAAGLNRLLADPALAARLGAAAAERVPTWDQSNQLVLEAYSAFSRSYSLR